MENNKILFIALITICILLAIAASIGFFIKDFYILDSNILASATRGVDLFFLVIILPVLLICLFLLYKGSQKAFIIILGILGIIIYNYTFMSFNIQFNRLFIIYVALLGLSSFTLLKYTIRLDLDSFKNQFSKKIPIKTIGIFQIIIGILFYLIWGKAIISANINNNLTDIIKEWHVPTSAIYVIDMAFLLPLIIWSGLLIIKRKSLGFLLSGINLIIILSMSLGLIFSFLMNYFDGYSIKIIPFCIFILCCCISLFLLVLFLREIKN